MKIKLADGLPYHPTMKHPRTGQRLQAIMINRKGLPVWPVIGASEDDGKDDTDDGDDADADVDADEDKPEDKGDGKKKPDPKADRIAQLEADIAKMRTHLSASDRKKAAAEQQLQQLKDKDLPDIERAKKEAEELKAGSAKKDAALRNLALTNAFLLASQKTEINWHDPEVAQAAATKYDGIEVDEDGNVTGMADVVKKLAKDKAFLVKVASKSEEDEEEKPKNGASGSGVGASGGKKNTKKGGELDKDELRRKYSALRN